MVAPRYGAKMVARVFFSRHFSRVVFSIVAFFVLYLISRYDSLLFHILVELVSIILAGAVFVLAWNFRRFYQNNFQAFIGTAFVTAALFDAFHMMTYPGMGVYTFQDPDLASQLWLTARGIQIISLFLAPFFLKTKSNMLWIIGAFALIAAGLFAALVFRLVIPEIPQRMVPLAAVDAAAEAMLVGVLAAAVVNMVVHRKHIDQVVLQWMILAMVILVLSEITFLLYGNVQDIGNIIGHYLKIISAYLVYKAIIETEAGSIYADMTRFRETERALLQSTRELRESELSARRSLAELGSIYATAPVGLCFLDPQMKIQAVNEALANLIRQPPSELQGRLFRAVLPADSAEQIEYLLAQVIATGQPVSNQVVSESVDADPAQRAYWSVSFHPVVDREGTMLGTSCVLQDVTEGRRAEMALQSSERNLQSFIQYAPTAIAMFDRNLCFLAASQKFLEDHRVGERSIAGRPADEVLVDMPVSWRAAYPRCLEGFVEKQDEEMITRSDGSVDWFRWEMHPWYDHLGAAGGIIIFFEVITSRKQAEEALARAHAALQEYAQMLSRSNQELEQFALVASHDLQEPLRKIKFYGSELLEQYDRILPAEAHDALHRMRSAAERMQLMVDGLLELSRVTTRGGNFSVVNLTTLVADVVSDLEPRLQIAGGTVTVGDLPAVEVDEMQIRRLFQNLIGNALKFHRAGVPPDVHITTAEPFESGVDRVSIAVRDNGIGFDEANASRIFKPFQRLHGRSDYEGTGLGLAISQKIVERHNGKIEVHSQPGQGSVFIVTLPVRQQNS